MNRSEIANVPWDVPLVNTTMDAKSSRIKVAEPFSWRLIGADGSTEGGLRPFPGFMEVHRFNWERWSLETLGQHDETSEIIDIKSVNFTVADRWYGYGFVYRVRRRNGSPLADVFIDYYHTQLGRWIMGQRLMGAVPLSPREDPLIGRQMTATTQGRNLYVMIKDKEPVLAYIQREAPYGLRVIPNTGPGLRPDLTPPSRAGPLGAISTTGDANRPGAGQLVLLEFPPKDVDPLIPDGHAQEDLPLASLTPGDYAFGYVLYNSQTGKRSALSQIADVRKVDFDVDPADDVDPVPLYAAMEVVYDETQYDRAYFYRSVRVQDAGGVYIAGILHLDGIVDLSTITTVNTLSSTLAQAVYWYELSDKQLVFQSTFQDRTLYDADMPKGGAAIWYEGALVVGAISQAVRSASDDVRREDEIRGVGEIRWSALTEVSPELFPPENRYYPSLQYDEVIAFEKAGPNVIGFSRARQFMIRKEDQYMRVTEMHEGFGVVNPRATATVGSLVYFITSKGLKSVASDAQVDEARAINHIIQTEWRNDLGAVELTFDPLTSCLYVFNPIRGSACLFWFNSAIVTELRELPFYTSTRGAWPQNFVYEKMDLLNPVSLGSLNVTYRNPLEERAFFVQNAPKNNPSDRVLGFQFRLFVHDSKRARSHRGAVLINRPCLTLLPVEDDAVFNVQSEFKGGDTISLGDAYGTTWPTEVWGYRLYVLHAANPELIHKSAVVRCPGETSGDFILTEATAEALHGLEAGDIVGFSPVYFEWQGALLGTQADDGTPIANQFDYFSVKHAETMGASFAGVTTPPLEDRPAFVSRFKATIYRGTEPLPAAEAFPTLPDGSPVASVVDRESIHHAAFGTPGEEVKHGIAGTTLTPGLIIICPSLDFELLGVRVQGRILATDRSAKP